METDYRSGEYEVIRIEPRYKNEVAELLMPLWGPDREKNAAYLDWKHYFNPYTQNPILYVSLHRGRVVGVSSHFACCWQAGQPDQRYLCVAGGDAVVHPDHRRHGLHRIQTSMALRELENSAYDFDICLGSNQYTEGSAIKLGWTVVGELRPMNRQSWVRQIARKMPLIPRTYHHLFNRSATQQPSESAIQPFHLLDRNYDRTKDFGQSGIVLEKKPRPEAMAMLVSRQRYDGRIRHVRDQQFYAWRYQNPLSEYRFLFCEKGELKGFLVLQQVLHTYSNATHIVDWEATSVEVFSDLLQTVICWGGFSSISIWSVTLADDMIKVLTKHGFKSRSSESTTVFSRIIVKPLHPGGNWSMGGRDLLEISNWDLRPIYSDGF
jgi:GNAT superfamily N-acetyltransferase